MMYNLKYIANVNMYINKHLKIVHWLEFRCYLIPTLIKTYFRFGGRHLRFAVKEQLPVMLHIAPRKHGYNRWNFVNATLKPEITRC